MATKSRINKRTMAQIERGAKRFYNEALQAYWVGALEGGSAQAGTAAAVKHLSKEVDYQKHTTAVASVVGAVGASQLRGNRRAHTRPGGFLCEARPGAPDPGSTALYGHDGETPESVLISREEPEAPEEADSAQQWRAMERLVRRLPPEDRLVIEGYLRGEKQSVTGKALGLTQQGVSVRLEQIIAHMRQAVEMRAMKPAAHEVERVRGRLTATQFRHLKAVLAGEPYSYGALHRGLDRLDPDTKLVRYVRLLVRSGYLTSWAR